MKKKFLALVLTMAMVLSLVPVTALAADTPAGGDSQENTRDNLTMKKTVTPVPNQDGTYTVRLESYATGSVSTTQTPVPMDIVLVLDVSGSMGDKIASYDYRKTEETSWSVSDVYHDYYDWGACIAQMSPTMPKLMMDTILSLITRAVTGDPNPTGWKPTTRFWGER